MRLERLGLVGNIGVRQRKGGPARAPSPPGTRKSTGRPQSGGGACTAEVAWRTSPSWRPASRRMDATLAPVHIVMSPHRVHAGGMAALEAPSSEHRSRCTDVAETSAAAERGGMPGPRLWPGLSRCRWPHLSRGSRSRLTEVIYALVMWALVNVLVPWCFLRVTWRGRTPASQGNVEARRATCTPKFIPYRFRIMGTGLLSARFGFLATVESRIAKRVSSAARQPS